MKLTNKHHLLLAETSGPSQLEDRSAWDGLWVLETLSQKNLVRSALPHHRSSVSMWLRPPGTSGSRGARTDNMSPPASGLHIQPPTYAAHMQGRVCLSWGHRSPPTRRSADMLTGFCPGGGGARVRANSWSPGRGMGAGALQHQSSPGSEHWETGLLATAQRADWEPCPPPQPGSSVEKCRRWRFSWVAPTQCTAFPVALHSCWGICGRGDPTTEPKWQSIRQDTGPDPWPHFCFVGLAREGTFWLPVLTARVVPVIEGVSTSFSGQRTTALM